MDNLNYIQEIVDTDYTIWPKYYPSVNEIINELDEIISDKGLLSFEIKNKIFWFFRNYFSEGSDFLKETHAEKLYVLILKFLEKDACLYNLYDSDLSLLEDVLIVLERIVYLYSDLKGDVSVLNPLIKAATYKKELNTSKNATAFIRALLKCFNTFLPNEKLTKSIELIHLTQALQEFITQQLVWTKNDPVALLVQGLLFLKDLRCKYKENKAIYPTIDHYAIKLCDRAIRDIPKAYPYYSTQFIQEDIGAAYVKYLEPASRELFNGLYNVLCPEDVLPQQETLKLTGNNRLPNVHLKINYTALSSEKNNKMKNFIFELHEELKDFLQATHIKSLESDKIVIQLNVFKDQQQFDRYGYLVWSVDSSGGGICLPAVNDQPTTAFVYQIDQGFQNLKHELTHAYMDNILGNYYAQFLPGVFVEGIADFFDKGPSNFDKLIQMQRLLQREPLKTFPDIVTLNAGGSVVYLYGYFCIAFFIEEKLTLLSEILNAAQTKNQSQVTQLIKGYGLEQKDAFNNWMQRKLSQLVMHLFKAVREQDRVTVNQLLAGMDSQHVNTQEAISQDTPLHSAIGLWVQFKNDTDTSKRADAVYIVWCLLLKGAELKNVKNAKGESPFDLIEDSYDQELIERYATDAKHYIDLDKRTYTETMTEGTITC